MHLRTIGAAAGLLALISGAAVAADHEVQMLNRGSDGQTMVFEPAFLKVEPGDTVTFVPTDPSHNSESIADLIPEGAEAWKGAINQEITVTLDVEGLYAYKCLPHFGMGMVGLIQVGDNTDNLADIEAATMPGRAGDRMADLIAQVQDGEAADGETSAD